MRTRHVSNVFQRHLTKVGFEPTPFPLTRRLRPLCQRLVPTTLKSYNNWATLGIEPRTPSTLRKDHTTRPSSREKLCAKATVVPTLDSSALCSDSFLQASSRYDRLL